MASRLMLEVKFFLRMRRQFNHYFYPTLHVAVTFYLTHAQKLKSVRRKTETQNKKCFVSIPVSWVLGHGTCTPDNSKPRIPANSVRILRQLCGDFRLSLRRFEANIKVSVP